MNFLFNTINTYEIDFPFETNDQRAKDLANGLLVETNLITGNEEIDNRNINILTNFIIENWNELFSIIFELENGQSITEVRINLQQKIEEVLEG